MHDTRPLLSNTNFPQITRAQLTTLQVNLGYLCNLSCLHCHVNAGPKRKEIMEAETVSDILRYIENSDVKTLDLTGGAPEMNPHFKDIVRAATAMGIKVIDRCNLTILLEPGYEDMADFLAEHRVEIVASLPCYLESNVDQQRGDGVFQQSIIMLKQLNALGYAQDDSELILSLVYNPQGPVLPPPQQQLEQDYRTFLGEKFGIKFNQLFTITNMPINRFGSTLVSKGQFEDYMKLLHQAHQDANVSAVMCRSLISIDWQGYVYDCDFNQMLELPLPLNGTEKIHIRDLINVDLQHNKIAVLDHCYACTAGQGSSCGGALV